MNTSFFKNYKLCLSADFCNDINISIFKLKVSVNDIIIFIVIFSWHLGQPHALDAGHILVDLTNSGHADSKDTLTCNVVCPQDMSNPLWMIGDTIVDDGYSRLEDSTYLLDIRKAAEEMDIESKNYNLTFSYDTKVGVDIHLRRKEGTRKSNKNI